MILDEAALDFLLLLCGIIVDKSHYIAYNQLRQAEKGGWMRMIESIRRFNRYYARMLGVFGNKYLDVDYSPTEVRIIGEIGRNPGVTARAISRYLSLDKSYLSRIIRRLAGEGMIERGRDERDARAMPLHLTPKGEELFAELDVRANRQVERQIERLSGEERRELVEAMERIRRIMSIDQLDAVRSESEEIVHV